MGRKVKGGTESKDEMVVAGQPQGFFFGGGGGSLCQGASFVGSSRCILRTQLPRGRLATATWTRPSTGRTTPRAF